MLAALATQGPGEHDAPLQLDREPVDSGGHPAEHRVAAPEGARRIGARAVDRRPDDGNRHVGRHPDRGVERLAAGDGTCVDRQVVTLRSLAAAEALPEQLVTDSDVTGLGCDGILPRHRRRNLEVESRRSRLGDEIVTGQQERPSVLVPDVELSVERRREAKRDLDDVRVDLHREQTGGVAAVPRVQRPAVAPRDRERRGHDVGVRIALAQVNQVVGDIAGNRERILAFTERAKADGADLVVFPELAVTGYPPEDLLLRPGFVAAARASVDEIARATHGITVLVGTPWLDTDLSNACAVIAEGSLKGVFRKWFLPNYGVFDEHRYFAESRELVLVRSGAITFGLTICEDVWQPGAPATDEALAGAQLLVNLSASPFHVGKAEDREEMLVTRARDNACYLAFCNLVGGQDELVFDGHSVVLDDEGEVVARAPGFEEALLVVDIDPSETVGRRLRDTRRRSLARSQGGAPAATVLEVPAPARTDVELRPAPVAFEPELEQMRRALTMAVRDYAEKNGFTEAIVSVSGGIDSALTAALLVDALGAEHVHCVSMPSQFSSEGTRDDARELARNLGCDFREIPIEGVVTAYHEATGGLAGLAAENLQARIRGTIVMALSNTHGWLVVATGNKSELAVGYATLYGDMVGGYALLKDVFKLDVFRLSRYLNERAGRELIPVTTIERPPSAELRADQRDDQSLPPYELLDPVLEAYIELDRSREELLDEFDAETVERVLALVDRAEYKRRQAAPGVKLRPRAFGRDWRAPITNRWRG